MLDSVNTLSKLLLLLGSLLTGNFSFGEGARTLVIRSSQDADIDLSPYVEIWQDKQSRSGIEDFPAFESKFEHKSPKDLTRIKKSDVFWVRFLIENRTDQVLKRYLYSYSPHNPFFEAYVFRENGTREYLGDFGYRVPAKDRERFDFRPIVPFVLQPGEIITFLARTKFYRTNTFRYQLMTEKIVGKYNHINWAIIAAYMGCVGGLLLYNLFLYWTLRDKAYLYYLFFGACMFSTFFL